jgi:hypothetical protein
MTTVRSDGMFRRGAALPSAPAADPDPSARTAGSARPAAPGGGDA